MNGSAQLHTTGTSDVCGMCETLHFALRQCYSIVFARNVHNRIFFSRLHKTHARDTIRYCSRHPTTLDCPDVLAQEWASAAAASGGSATTTPDVNSPIEAKSSAAATDGDGAASAWSGPEFVATSEWQTVVNGQPIPPGEYNIQRTLNAHR